MSDYAKVLTDLWSAQGEAMLRAQEQAARAMTEGMQALVSGKLPALFAAPPEAAELKTAADASVKLWSAATSLSTELAAKLAKFGDGESDGTLAAVFGRIADTRQWLVGPSDMDEALARMAEGPRLADLFDLERRYARVTQAWMQTRRRALEHNAVVLEAWLKAGNRFTETIGARAPDATELDPKQVMTLWTDIANRQLLETQRSEPYLRTQREMIRATTDLRLAQQDLVEHLGRQYGLPTRTELDDLHRTVTTMRREIRKLRRAVTPPLAPTPTPAADPAKIKAKRRKGSPDANPLP